ncbi:MAG: MiaB/RimO family radical SAM methylthiotransferase [Oscillospiraceae bacterium]|jgi:threonylcarbamoyladenosine tRNA methylthiotransferase MtaB|nr:MiaB/RimO family radical SAM methylthiotransferase [Oscillospiraceae bacterium]
MRIVIATLGCRTNQAESAGMAELLRRRGHEVLPPSEAERCDAVIVNTCTVTATADKKSRNAVRRLRRQYPDALIAVCGCLPQTGEVIPDADIVGGTANRAGFAEALEKRLPARVLTPLPSGFEDSLPDARPLRRSRAYIRIQDGCDNRCAYCKVPQARGAARSRAAESVVRAAKEAAENGAAEIVLTGIEIASYLPSLPELTAAVCRAAAPVPVRLSSLDPRRADAELAQALTSEKNFRPAFHLSLQSCCDAVLAAMGRRYAAADIFAAFACLREAWRGVTIAADIIVGFPGETDGDFLQTLQTLQTLKPDGLHIFPYSRRPGTPAASMPGQHTRAVKADRARRLREIFPK